MALDDRDKIEKVRAKRRLKGIEEIPSDPPLKDMPPGRRRSWPLWQRESHQSLNVAITETRHRRAPGDAIYRMDGRRNRHPVETFCWGILTVSTISAVLAVALAVLPGAALPSSIPDGWNPLLLVGSLDWSTPREVAQNATWIGVLAFLVVGVFRGRWSPLTLIGWLVLCLVLAGVPV